jgi:hypothetical protein
LGHVDVAGITHAEDDTVTILVNSDEPCFEVRGGPEISHSKAFRLKSRSAVDQLIRELEQARDLVWPPPNGVKP